MAAYREVTPDLSIRSISSIIALLLFLCNYVHSGQNKSGYTTKITPERLKYELKHLLKIHKERAPHESRPQLETLYESITSDIEMVKLVKLDIFVRNLATLKSGESCNPLKQDLLDRPPTTVKFGDPNPKGIQEWQKSLLLNRDPMCNYLKFLQCHPDTKKCCCKEGLVLRNGHCVLELGDNCGSDYFFKGFYFDALKNVKYLVPDPSPRCQPGTTCQKRPLFFRKKCWCDEPRTKQGTCNDSSIFPPELTYPELRSKVDELFSLKFDQECDPEFQGVIFDPPEYDLTDTRTRIEKYKSILDFPLLKLCNVSSHLNCSAETRRCACWDSLTFQRDTNSCHAIRGNPCGQGSLRDEFSPGGPRIWHLQRVFARNLASSCVTGAQCTGSNKCQCVTNFGDLCRFPGSIFTQVLHQPVKWTSAICEEEIYNVYDQVNKNMLKLQKEMVLDRGEVCRAGEDYEESRLDKIMKFWHQLERRWDSFTTESVECKEMLLQLNEISNKSAKLAEEGFDFCDRTRGLCCGDHTAKCVCLKGTTFQDGRCRLLGGQLCDRWNTHVPIDTPCVVHANCRPIRDGRHVCQCLIGPGPICKPPPNCPNGTMLEEGQCRLIIGELCGRWNTDVPAGTPCVQNADCLQNNHTDKQICQCKKNTIWQKNLCRIRIGYRCGNWSNYVPSETPCQIEAECLQDSGGQEMCQSSCPNGTAWQDGKCRIVIGEPCDRWNKKVHLGTPCVLNAHCVKDSSGQKVCQALCQNGTIWQDDRCRIIVGEPCGRWNKKVPLGTPCVLNAHCLNDSGDQEVCQASCPTGTKWQDDRCRIIVGEPCGRWNKKVRLGTPCVLNALCLNDSSGQAVCQAVCPNGTAWQDGKCRILVAVPCERWNKEVPSGTPCVVNAICLVQPGSSDDRHICVCNTGPGPLCGSSVDPKPTKPPVGNSSTTTVRPLNQTMTADEKGALNELLDIIVELSLDRVVANQSSCVSEPNEEFLEIAKEFSNLNKEKIKMGNVTQQLRILTRIFDHGYHVCDVQKFHMCSEFDELCVCDQGLVTTATQSCAVGPGEKCNVTTKVYDLKELYILPNPPCVPGYSCILPPINATFNSTNLTSLNSTNLTTLNRTNLTESNSNSTQSRICVRDPHVTGTGYTLNYSNDSWIIFILFLFVNAIV